MPAIKDIANASNTSVDIVYKILGGNAGNYDKDISASVWDTAEKFGWNIDAITRCRRVFGMTTLGVLGGYMRLLQHELAYFEQVLQGIFVGASDFDVNVLMISRQTWENDWYGDMHVYTGAQCNGLFVFPGFHITKNIPALIDYDIPFIMVGKESEEQSYTLIDIDNYNAMKIAVQYLIDNGHRSIAYIDGVDINAGSSERRKAFLDAMKENGLPAGSKSIAPSDWTIEGGYQAATVILENHADKLPTAIVGSNDECAIGAIMRLHDLGYNVPDEISVIGFDDIRQSELNEPPLTTIRQPMMDIGYMAVDLLLQKILMPDQQIGNVLLPGELVVRDTVAARK